MNFSLSAFFPSLFSTSFIILLAVLSLYSFSALSVRVLSPLTEPERTLDPFSTLTGTLSPVSALVSTKLSPSMTVESTASFSPLLRRIVSPTFTSSGFTDTHSLSFFIVTLSEERSMSFPIEVLLDCVARRWKYSPIW